MKKRILQLVILLCTLQFSYAQSDTKVYFRNMALAVPGNSSTFDWLQFSSSFTAINGKRFAIAHFTVTPNENTRKQLINSGIELTQYISNKAYTIAITKPITSSVLQQANIRGIIQFPVSAKLDDRLKAKSLPSYAVVKPGTVDVVIHFSSAMSLAEVLSALPTQNIQVISTAFLAANLITIRLPQSKIQTIAQLPFVEFLQPISPADKKLNDEVRSNTRANILNAPVSRGGENLNGKGVVIGIGDDADIRSHVDLADRVIDRSAFLNLNHGTQIAGVAAGAGIKEALYQGVAPAATLVGQIFGGILSNAARYVSDYGMAVTNNSYGAISGDCSYAGVYDLYSRVLDEQAFSLPGLLHVFAAGNDGSITCPGYLKGYHTVLGGYQSAKNIVSVGWGEKIPIASDAGSHGPTADGRIKPDITATGSEVRSTGANNTYVTDYGSSLSAPAVAGGAALLIEKYRLLNAGNNPHSALIKALLMNGATDIDNAGPDYKSGYGWMNLNRSLAMMKDGHIIKAAVVNGGVAEHTINIQPAAGQLKIMLYWHDPASAVFARQALVNDLDLEVVTPAAAMLRPWVLDTSHNNITALATRGIDHINNVEQVTLIQPAGGNYTIRVKGNVNANANQEYYIVYDVLPAVIDLTFPAAGEPMVTGELMVINWDAWDASNNTFTLQYSLDNGTNWININTNINGDARQYNWQIPNLPTGQAKVRLLRNGTALADEGEPFVILPQAFVTLGAATCPGYMAINWNTIAGATDYEVYKKQGAEMLPIASTTNTSFILSGLDSDSTYWLAVKPRINGAAGRRSDAVDLRPNTGDCAGTISDNDLLVDSILSPLPGRKFTATEITSGSLAIRIKNLDDAAVTNFTVSYSINGGPFVSQAVSATINPLSAYVFNVSGLNFSAVNTYTITAVVKNAVTDPVTANDTLVSVIRQLANDPVNLPFTESFENAPSSMIPEKQVGIPGLDRWDFLASTPFGRLRTFVNSGIARSGSKALTLDVDRFIQTGNTNYVVATFNMTQFQAAGSNIRMDFWVKDHGQSANSNNRVWIRGSDSDTWIVAYNLDSAKAMFNGTWQQSASIQVSQLLLANGQNFSPSFQVRFGQFGVIGAGDDQHNGGYSIDDFRLYTAANDVAVLGITSPATNGCGLGSAEQVEVEIKNQSGNTLTNIPIKLQVDGAAIIVENIASIAPQATVNFQFQTGVNLSAPGQHSVTVYTDLAGDEFKENDSIVGLVIVSQPVINAFPYLQNFENGAASWYAEGRNSSWQLGQPASIKINKAASGNNAWKTSLQGTYNDDELSYLYSPCFNLTGLSNPWLSLSIAMDMEQCNESVCDRVWVEYSADGKTWLKLGTTGQGLNWYNRADGQVWDSSGFIRWHSAGIPLPAGTQVLRLRFVMRSDEFLIKEGVAIDDIHIYDKQYDIYTGPGVSNPVTQTVSGNSWIPFTSGGQIFSGVNANGSSLGNTGSQVFVRNSSSDSVRYLNGQYYLNRNITIKPTRSSSADSTAIRFYFTDAEIDTLINASGCNNCSRVEDAYSLGITKYNDADDTKENGDLSDNTEGTYQFIPAAHVEIVPYGRGYYAAFKTKDFSEFWLTNGEANTNLPLPATLSSFNAVRQAKDVLIKWTMATEFNIARYEVQVASTLEAFQRQQFSVLKVVIAGNGTQATYQVTDEELNKTGARYYRLKIVDKDQQVRYSSIKVVVFDASGNWLVYPNPVRDRLQIVAQSAVSSKIEIQILNMTGQVKLSTSYVATGFADKFSIELGNGRLAAGLYIVKIMSDGRLRQFKVVKL